MKITKAQLKQIIKEVLEATLDPLDKGLDEDPMYYFINDIVIRPSGAHIRMTFGLFPQAARAAAGAGPPRSARARRSSSNSRAFTNAGAAWAGKTGSRARSP